MSNSSIQQLKRESALDLQRGIEADTTELQYTRDYYENEYVKLEKERDILERMLENNPDLYKEYRKAKREIEDEKESGNEME